MNENTSRVRFGGAGFTLFEMLLVIVIVGIIAGLVMPSLSHDDDVRVLEQSLRQALAVMQLQEEEAALTGSQRGLLFSQRTEEGYREYSYRWLVWSSINETWLEAELPLRFNGVFEGASDLQLEVDGRELEVPEYKPELPPQVVLYASGEVTDFELRLLARNAEGEIEEQGLVGGYLGIRLRSEDEEKSRR